MSARAMGARASHASRTLEVAELSHAMPLSLCVGWTAFCVGMALGHLCVKAAERTSSQMKPCRAGQQVVVRASGEGVSIEAHSGAAAGDAGPSKAQQESSRASPAAGLFKTQKVLASEMSVSG